jgi:hypothetical protein
VENAIAIALKDDCRDGFVDTFNTYLWNARGNFAQPKKKVMRESTAMQITVVDDFSEYE